jgi:hypothetical protein
MQLEMALAKYTSLCEYWFSSLALRRYSTEAWQEDLWTVGLFFFS